MLLAPKYILFWKMNKQKAMYSSSYLSKHLVSVPFLVLVATQLLCACNVSSLNLTNTYLHHKCLASQGYYKPGSKYERALNSLIYGLSTTNFRGGFDHVTEAGTATIIFQCRGDSYWSKCRPCYNAALSEVRKRCPRNKGGIIWFDQCFVEITSISIDDSKDEIDYDNIFYLHNPKKVIGDAKLFNKETMSLLEKLILKANDKNNKDDGRIALYAAGEKKIEGKKLYAMVQCIRDVYMPNLCKVCLEMIIRKYFPKCCDGRQGGRVLGKSCNFRYELYPFLRTNKTV